MKMYRPRAVISGSLPSLIVYFIIWKKIIAVIGATFPVRKESLKKSRLVWDSNPWPLPYWCSALASNWANKPTESRLLNWFVITPWKDDDEVMNIWKSNMRTAGWRIYMKEDHRRYRCNFCSWEKKIRLFK